MNMRLRIKRGRMVLLLALLLSIGCIGCTGRQEEGRETAEISPAEQLKKKTWTPQEIEAMFVETEENSGRSILGSVAVTDFAFDRVGAVLFTEEENQSIGLVFLTSEGAPSSTAKITGTPCEALNFTYCGNGTVIFQMKDSEQRPFECRITFSVSEDGKETFFTRKDTPL